jgi:hypothetical protein
MREGNAPHTKTSRELGFDDLFDWVKYDADMRGDYDWTRPGNETLGLFSSSGGASDMSRFGTRIEVSDPQENQVRDFIRWQRLLNKKREQDDKISLNKAFKAIESPPLYFLTQQQMLRLTNQRPVTQLPKPIPVVTPGKGNLKAIWEAISDNEEKDEEEEIEAPKPSNQKGKGNEKAKTSESSTETQGVSGAKRKRPAYPTPPSSDPSSGSSSGSISDDEDDESESDSDDDTKPPSKAPRRKGHMSGIDRKTGKLTLVGRFPPEIGPDGNFRCRDPVCNEINKNWDVSTKNGYKYHLKNVCPGNPNSVQSLRQTAGQVSKTGNVGCYSEKCGDCGKNFKCEEGFRKHREENPTTKDGKCRERRGRLEMGNSVGMGNSVETAIPLE